jgi:predicted lipoprotein with Yx(FWY)xxD motif
MPLATANGLALNFKPIAAVFVVLAVVFAGSTVYLLAYPGGGTSTVTSTFVATSAQTTTVTGAGSAGDSVGIAYKAGIGFYLVSGSGMTLYYRTSDNPSTGMSTCTGGCVAEWPVFHTNNLVLPPGLNASSFKTVARSDGTEQLTYNGWPLYNFIGDQKPGDTQGQGLGGVWFAYALHDTSQMTTTSSTDQSSSAISSTTSSTSTPEATSTTPSMSTSTTASVSVTTTSYSAPYTTSTSISSTSSTSTTSTYSTYSNPYGY